MSKGEREIPESKSSEPSSEIARAPSKEASPKKTKEAPSETARQSKDDEKSVPQEVLVRSFLVCMELNLNASRPRNLPRHPAANQVLQLTSIPRARKHRQQPLRTTRTKKK